VSQQVTSRASDHLPEKAIASSVMSQVYAAVTF